MQYTTQSRPRSLAAPKTFANENDNEDLQTFIWQVHSTASYYLTSLFNFNLMWYNKKP